MISSVRVFLRYATSVSVAGRIHGFAVYGSTNTLSSISIKHSENIKRYRYESFRMTSAYTGEPGTGMDRLENIDYLPYKTKLKTGQRVEVAPFREEDWPTGMELMNLIIREGKTWPFDQEFDTMDAYRGYFLSHAALVVRATEDPSLPLPNNGLIH